MTEPTETAVERYIRIHGPMPIEETMISKGPPNYIQDQLVNHEAVGLFWPRRGSPGSGSRTDGSFSPGQVHQPVLFHSDHDPETVLDSYFDANPSLIEHSSLRAILQVLNRRYPEFRETTKRVLKRRYPDRWAECWR